MALSLFGERPHLAAMSASPLVVFTRWIANIHAARTRRTTLATLLELDHCRLDDLGINRQDVVEAMRGNAAGRGNVLNAARATKARL